MRTSFQRLATVVLMFVLAAATATAQDPTVTPFSLLPGDDVVSGALCNPNSPVISRGGNNFLVVWSDQRSKLGESATQSDIFGMRLDAGGNPLDTVPLAIGVTSSEDRTPRVCWNGSNWLVTWSTYGPTDYYYGAVLAGARVSAAGEVLDSPALTLIATESSSLAGYTVGTDGSNWVVVTSGTTASDVGVRGFRLSNAGVLLDPGGVVIPTTTPSYSVPPIGFITAVGSTYLYVYTMWNSSDTTADDVMAIRLNSSLGAIGQPFYVSRATGNQTVAGLASNGSAFMVLYNGPGAETYITDLWAARVSTSGTVLDSAGINISRGNSPVAYSLTSRVEWNGTNYIALWAYNGISSARITSAGSLLDSGGVAMTGITATEITSGTSGGYQTVSLNNNSSVTTTSISPTRVVGPSKLISTGSPSQYIGSLANNGSSWMLAFLSATANDIAVNVQGLASDGSALDTEPVTLGTGSATTIGRPKLAWNGSVYLVVWTDTNRGGVVGCRIDASGNLVDPEPFFIVAGSSPSVSALGANFLVAYTYAPVYQYQYTSAYVIRVDGVAGTPLGSAINVGGAFAVTTSVTTVGNRWLVLWQQNLSHNSQQGSCLGVFVTANGALENAFGYGGSGAYRKSPVAAVSDDTVLLVWAEGSHYLNYDILARRMAFDGTFLDAQNIVVSNSPYSQYAPAAAWNGDEFVVAFNDGRNRTSQMEVVDVRSDIYGARVTETGVVLDPDGFPITAEPAQEQYPQVGVLGADTMFSASLFIGTAPYAGYRIGTAYLYGAPGPNTPPVAALQAVPAQGYAPLPVQFSSNGSYDPEAGPLSYAWTFGDGGTGNGSSPAHTYADVGSYTATLTVTDAEGLSDSKSMTILVLQPNRPPVLVSTCTPSSGMAPLTVTVDTAGSYDPDGGTFSYWWDFGDGQGFASPNGTHVYTTAGTYTVRVTLTDQQGLSSSRSYTVNVSSSVIPFRCSNITLSGVRFLGTVVISGKVTLIDQNNVPVGGAMVNVKWTLPNGTVRTQTATTNNDGVASIYVRSYRGTSKLQVTGIKKVGYILDAASSVMSKTMTN